MSILSSIFTKDSTGLSIGIIFLSIYLDDPFSHFWCFFLSLTYWGLALQLNHLMDFVNPKTPVSILYLDFLLLLQPSFFAFSKSEIFLNVSSA